MKTQTKLKLIEIIKKRNVSRPSDLAKELGLSPQIIHRHLKTLVAQGIIESKNTPPFTQYFIAGTPNFETAFEWFASKKEPNSFHYVCETRDVFSARLNHFLPLQKQGLSTEDLPLVISIAGEIGNNSFDHNLGQWQDVPGCWFEIQVTHKHLWILIADRGQGIFNSLAKVIPNLASEQTAIEKAFEEVISGRSPEQRGNGLKYVGRLIKNQHDRGIACVSGKGSLHYGYRGNSCMEILNKVPQKKTGTITLVSWGLV